MNKSQIVRIGYNPSVVFRKEGNVVFCDRGWPPFGRSLFLGAICVLSLTLYLTFSLTCGALLACSLFPFDFRPLLLALLFLFGLAPATLAVDNFISLLFPFQSAIDFSAMRCFLRNGIERRKKKFDKNCALRVCIMASNHGDWSLGVTLQKGEREFFLIMPSVSYGSAKNIRKKAREIQMFLESVSSIPVRILDASCEKACS